MTDTLLSALTTLHELEQSIISNGGEITPQLENDLKNLQDGITNKIDSYAIIMEHLKQRAVFWNEKAALTKKYASTCNSIVERLKANIKTFMYLQDQHEIEGDEIRFKLSPAAPTLDIDEKILPDEYFKTEIVRTIDKDLVKAKLKEGVEIPGAKFIENYSLRNYPNHKVKNGKKLITS